MWEKDVNIHEVKEIRLKNNVYFGVGAINKIYDITKEIKGKSVDKVIVVSGKNAYKSTGAWDVVEKALIENGIGYINYTGVTPNPTTENIDTATSMAKDFGAKAVIAIGGGSVIDTGKSVAILLKYPEKNASELYECKFAPEEAATIIAINTTHGTGTEANRFAVATILEKDYKPVIAYDCIYPTYSIDDPQLAIKLPKNQTIYVSIDAVNHVIEAATTKAASPYSITLAKETIRLVAKYLPIAIAKPEDLEARFFLMYAAMIAGTSFDNGLLHYTHALEHPLSAVKPNLSHGLGLAMLLPAVVKYIYKEKCQTLSDILAPIIPDLNATPAGGQQCAEKLEEWLVSVGATSKLSNEGFTESDVEKLTELAFVTPSLDLLLSMAPNEATRGIVSAIYKESLKFYK